MNLPTYQETRLSKIIDNVNRINFEIVSMQHQSDQRVNGHLRQFAVKINSLVHTVNNTNKYIEVLEHQVLEHERRIELLEASILLSRLKFNH